MQLGSGEILSHIAMSLLIVDNKLLLLFLNTSSILWTSKRSGSPFTLFLSLSSNIWRLPMQLPSG
jgi:hypothetical protein